MATQNIDKYADYKYVIDSETERREVEWLISQGDFKSMDDFIEKSTKAEIRYMKEQDAMKRKRAAARKKRVATKKGKSAV